MRVVTSSPRPMKRFVAPALLLAAGLAFSGATAAYAAPVSQDERAAGQWYVDRLKFDDLQAMGATGEGIKIAVVDSAINLDAAELQGANITVKGSYCASPETGETAPAVSTDVELSGHGTDVVSMLVGNGVAADGGSGTRGIVPDAEIWFYSSTMSGAGSVNGSPECEAFDGPNDELYADKKIRPSDADYFVGEAAAYAAWHAVDDGADIVVYSAASGDSFGWSFTQRKALREGVPIVAATSNPDGDIDSAMSRVYPYVLNGVVAVSGVDADGHLLNGDVEGQALVGDARGSSNLGFLSAATALLTASSDDGWGPSIGYGNSLAAPLVAGTIALGMQMNPDATANQVLQVMIRTTGDAEALQPVWGGPQVGYGIANPTAMLEVDPTGYPDENPLFVMNVDDPRCALEDGTTPETFEECAWSISPTADEVWPASGGVDPATETPRVADEPGAFPLMPILFVVGGVFLLGLIATAIIVPIVVTRSRRNSQQATGAE